MCCVNALIQIPKIWLKPVEPFIIIIIIHKFQSDTSPEELQGRCSVTVFLLWLWPVTRTAEIENFSKGLLFIGTPCRFVKEKYRVILAEKKLKAGCIVFHVENVYLRRV